MTTTSDGSSRKYTRTARFDEVLARELDLIVERRRGAAGSSPPAPAGDAKTPGRESIGMDEAVRRAQHTSTFGVAFSGGGIRSATFNLGVLQGLAEKRLLPRIDYLSTVSGGGYIGSWLHGVIKRTHNGRPDEARRTLLTGVSSPPGPPDEDPIAFLRKFSNYLAPRPGLFTADTWTIGAIWIRNVLLNQLIIVPAIAAAVALTLFALFLYQLPAPVFSTAQNLDLAAAAVALICFVAAIGYMVSNLRPIADRSTHVDPKSPDAAPARQPPAKDSLAAVLLVFAGAIVLGAGHFDPIASRLPIIGISIAMMAFIGVTGGFVECFAATHPGSSPLKAWALVLAIAVAAGLTGGLLVTKVWAAANTWPLYQHLVLGPPLVALSVMAAVILLIGLMGADYPDAAREWTARAGSMLAMCTLAWLVWFGVVVFGPWGVTWLLGSFEKSGLAAIVTWTATTLGGVLAGRSASTANGGDPSKSGRALSLLINVAPTLFLIGYLLAITTAVHATLPHAPTAGPSPHVGETREAATVSVTAPAGTGVQVNVTPDESGTLATWLAPAAAFATRYPAVLTLGSNPSAALDWTMAFLIVSGVVAVVASRRININEFSLHHFYKNRLVRCYLGATHGKGRQPHPYTGFDPLDDFALSGLSAEAKEPYYGPYPILNTTLNLNAGSELATQERKAASFVFTPAYSGFDPPTSRENERQSEEMAHTYAAKTSDSARSMAESWSPVYDEFEMHGYRPTRGYAYPAGPDIGTAVAISGAAASPNWGYHTSGPMAFLLTVFNARLGWWLGNPRWRLSCRESGPKFALKYLFAELLGRTNGRSQFVNLSDGGHFDNIGLYELVRRRCRFIVVCDSEEDQALTFGSLGAAIRKCRADFGVEIDINPDPIRKGTDGLSRAHCVVGRIIYPEIEHAFTAGLTTGINAPGQKDEARKSCGWLVYLKSSLTGDEPADVIEYQSQHHEFPHQSTADQFFSESQFESYRRLGYHVLRSAFEEVDLPAEDFTAVELAQPGSLSPAAPLLEERPLVAMFQALTSKWYAPIDVSGEAASRLADMYVGLLRRLAETNELQALHQELVHGRADGLLDLDRPSPALLAAGIELLQLMQNVWAEFGFEQGFNRSNPRSAGWVRVFQKWRHSPLLFERIWPIVKDDYNPLFQRFIGQLEKLPRDTSRP